MKKKIIKSLLTIACLLSSISASAYDFEVDGLQYDVVSLTDLTCKLVGSDKGFEGDFVIPSKVNYANRTLTVVEVGDYLFRNCSELTGITIPNSINSIGSRAFAGCEKLERVHFEDGDSDLELRANAVFAGCPITKLYIGRNILHYYYESPFRGIKTITNLTIGNTVTKINVDAFRGCSGLTSLIIPNSVTEIGDCAFIRCSGLTSLIIPNSVTEIGAGAFEDCSGLTNLIIPSSVTVIRSYTFSGCSGLINVTIPNSVTKIEVGAFAGCNSITSFTIPNSVTQMGAFFNKCTALTDLYMLNTTPLEIEDDYFTNNQYMTLNVYVPQEALEAYQNADGWKNFWNMQGFDPTGIKGVEMGGVNGDSKYFDLRGNRLDAPKRGINIINGKKVIVK